MQPRQKLSELVKRERNAGTGGSLGTGATATEEWSSHKLRRFVPNRKKATA